MKKKAVSKAGSMAMGGKKMPAQMPPNGGDLAERIAKSKAMQSFMRGKKSSTPNPKKRKAVTDLMGDTPI